MRKWFLVFCGILLYNSGFGVIFDQYKSLKGIKNMSVAVGVEGDAKNEISQTRLQSIAELYFREKNVGLDITDTSGYLLYADFYVLSVEYKDGSKTGNYVFTFSVSLGQPVFISRTEEIVLATTWEQMYYGFCHSKSRPSEIAEKTLYELLDFFLNDYLKANSKK